MTTDDKRMSDATDVGARAAEAAMSVCIDGSSDMGVALAAVSLAARTLQAFCDAKLVIGMRSLADVPVWDGE